MPVSFVALRIAHRPDRMEGPQTETIRQEGCHETPNSDAGERCTQAFGRHPRKALSRIAKASRRSPQGRNKPRGGRAILQRPRGAALTRRLTPRNFALPDFFTQTAFR